MIEYKNGDIPSEKVAAPTGLAETLYKSRKLPCQCDSPKESFLPMLLKGGFHVLGPEHRRFLEPRFAGMAEGRRSLVRATNECEFNECLAGV